MKHHGFLSTSDKPHYENVPFEVPSSWVWTTVGEISQSILYGVSESAKSRGTYRLLRITDIQDNTVNWNTVPFTDYEDEKAEAYLLKDGDILFARTGATVGKSYLVNNLQEKAIYASYLIRVKTNHYVLPEFVKYFFESGFYWEQVLGNSVGIGQPNVNGTILSNLELPIPPIMEQKRIVKELGKWLSIIDKIEESKGQLQKNISWAKSKVLDLAIHGKLVPQDPTDEPATELLKRINPNAEITSDNGHYQKLPEGWCETTLKHVLTIKSGNSINVRNCTQGHYPIYGGNGITGHTDDYNIKESTIVIGRVGYYCGSVYLVRGKAWVSDNAFITTIHKDIFYKKYLYYLLQFLNLRKFSNSTAQPVISGKTIYPIHVLIPPIREQKSIVAKIEEIFAPLNAIEASL